MQEEAGNEDGQVGQLSHSHFHTLTFTLTFSHSHFHTFTLSLSHFHAFTFTLATRINVYSYFDKNYSSLSSMTIHHPANMQK